MILTIKKQRTHVDSIINFVKEKIKGSREVSLCLTDLQRAAMSLGLVLRDIGSDTPYQKGNDVKTSEIDPRADVAKTVIEVPGDYDSIQIIKHARDIIQGLVDEMKDVEVVPADRHPIAVMWLEDAKMWLGAELNNIYEAQKGNTEN